MEASALNIVSVFVYWKGVKLIFAWVKDRNTRIGVSTYASEKIELFIKAVGYPLGRLEVLTDYDVRSVQIPHLMNLNSCISLDIWR
jgi:hypothetical protein